MSDLVPAAGPSWADLYDEELEELSDLEEEVLTKQQRLCRQRYLAMEAMDAAGEAAPEEEEESDDDYDFSEEIPAEELVENYDEDFDLSDEEHPFQEASDNHQEVEGSEEEEEEEEADPPKVNDHGIRHKVIYRLWDTYDVQHRQAFFPLIPRHDDLRKYYPEYRTPESWYRRPGFSAMSQVLTAIEEPVREELIMATTATFMDSSDSDSDATTSEKQTVTPLSEQSEAGAPCDSVADTVNTDTALILGGSDTVNTGNSTVFHRWPFRNLVLVRVCAVVDNARKVVDATLGLIR